MISPADLRCSVKNFWQSYPAGLEVRHASSPVAELTAWLWSPDGPQMDMRHYDLVAHGLAASYEDVQPGMSTAYRSVAYQRTHALSEHLIIADSRHDRRAGQAGQRLPLLAAITRVHSFDRCLRSVERA